MTSYHKPKSSTLNCRAHAITLRDGVVFGGLHPTFEGVPPMLVLYDNTAILSSHGMLLAAPPAQSTQPTVYIKPSRFQTIWTPCTKAYQLSSLPITNYIFSCTLSHGFDYDYVLIDYQLLNFMYQLVDYSQGVIAGLNVTAAAMCFDPGIVELKLLVLMHFRLLTHKEVLFPLARTTVTFTLQWCSVIHILRTVVEAHSILEGLMAHLPVDVNTSKSAFLHTLSPAAHLGCSWPITIFRLPTASALPLQGWPPSLLWLTAVYHNIFTEFPLEGCDKASVPAGSSLFQILLYNQTQRSRMFMFTFVIALCIIICSVWSPVIAGIRSCLVAQLLFTSLSLPPLRLDTITFHSGCSRRSAWLIAWTVTTLMYYHTAIFYLVAGSVNVVPPGISELSCHGLFMHSNILARVYYTTARTES